MQAILLFSNGKSRPLFRSDMSSFFSLLNVFLCFFLLLCLPFSAFCAFFLSPFSFLLSPSFSSPIPFIVFLVFIEYLPLSFSFFLFSPYFSLFSLYFLSSSYKTSSPSRISSPSILSLPSSGLLCAPTRPPASHV